MQSGVDLRAAYYGEDETAIRHFYLNQSQISPSTSSRADFDWGYASERATPVSSSSMMVEPYAHGYGQESRFSSSYPPPRLSYPEFVSDPLRGTAPARGHNERHLAARLSPVPPGPAPHADHRGKGGGLRLQDRLAEQSGISPPYHEQVTPTGRGVSKRGRSRYR